MAGRFVLILKGYRLLERLNLCPTFSRQKLRDHREPSPLARVMSCGGLTIIELMITVSIVGLLVGIGTPIFTGYLETAKNTKAIADIRNTLETGINLYEVANGFHPVSLADLERGGSILDPWGNTYRYLNLADARSNSSNRSTRSRGRGEQLIGQARKDRFLVPLNSDYDLYSKGKDGRSVSPLTSRLSRDDIVRANDGAYVGLASDY